MKRAWRRPRCMARQGERKRRGEIWHCVVLPEAVVRTEHENIGPKTERRPKAERRPRAEQEAKG